MALALRPGYRALLQAFGTTIAFGMLLQPALADEAVQKIQVTGSSIKRIQSEAALPVQTITGAEIQKTGATSVTELLQKLPSMQGFTNDAVSVGGGGAGYSSASVHNLGDTRTLVLLNGHRIAAFAGQTLTGASSGTDLNVIPIAAVERVEILTDGASSIYGTDAIAGVINFILKSDFTGFSVDAGYNQPEAGGAGEKRVSLTAGYGNIEQDRFNIMAAYSHVQRDSLYATQRPEFAYPKSGYYDFTDKATGQTARLRTSSLRGSPANVYWYDKTDAVTDPNTGLPVFGTGSFLGRGNPYRNATGGCPDLHVAGSGGCRFIYPSQLEIFPESTQDSALVNFNFKLNEKTTIFAEGLYSQHKMTAAIAPSIVDTPLSTSGDFYSTYLAPLGVPAGGVDVIGYWRVFDGGKRTTEDKDEANHLVVGVKGSLADWDYSSAFTHSVNKWNEYYRDGYLTNDAFRSALDAEIINPYVPSGHQSAAGMAALEAAKYKGLFKTGKTQLDMFEARASREIAQLPAGAVQLGLGVDYRKEKNTYTPSAVAQGSALGGIMGDYAQDLPYDVSRNSWGAFAETIVPLATTLEGQASIRFDDYSDVGSTVNYKIGGRWTPIKTLLIRGSYNTGFHAPQPAQRAPVRQLYGVTGNAYDCGFSSPDPRAVYCQAPGLQYNEFVQGNSDLKPEKSDQFTIGFRVEPDSWVSAGADYWNVKIKDQFGQPPETQLTSDWNATWNKGLLAPLYNDPLLKKPLLAFVLPQYNLGDRKVQGLDFDVRLFFKTSIGRLTSSLTGTYMFSDKQQLEKGGEYYQQVGHWSSDLGTVALRLQSAWATTLSTAQFDHTLTVNYRSGYDESRDGNSTGDVFDTSGNTVAVERRVDQYVTLDWQTAWRPMAGLKLVGGVYNIADAHPPFTINAGGAGYGQAVGYNTQVADPRGRTYYVQAGYTFK